MRIYLSYVVAMVYSFSCQKNTHFSVSVRRSLCTSSMEEVLRAHVKLDKSCGLAYLWHRATVCKSWLWLISIDLWVIGFR